MDLLSLLDVKCLFSIIPETSQPSLNRGSLGVNLQNQKFTILGFSLEEYDKVEQDKNFDLIDFTFDSEKHTPPLYAIGLFYDQDVPDR